MSGDRSPASVAIRSFIRSRVPRPSDLVRKLPFPYTPPDTPYGIEPAPTEPTTGVHYDSDWARRYPARFTRFFITEGFFRPVMRVLAKPTLRGTDRLDNHDGPLIFAANHVSHLDTPLLITSIPEPWRHQLVVGAAADYFFKTKSTAALSALAIGAFPVEREKVSPRSARTAIAHLREGWSLLIYPEGGRSPDGWGQEFRAGAAFLSTKTGVPVVPIHIAGTRPVLPKGAKWPTPGKAHVTFGEPLAPLPEEKPAQFAERIATQVAELGDEARTDWWSAKVRAAAGDTPPLESPLGKSWRRAWTLGAAKTRAPKRAWPHLG